jgi:hypothetical protein
MLDFPGSPATGATYTGPNGVIWQFDGVKWISGTGTTVYAPITDPVFLGNPQAPHPAAGDADASIATTAFVTNAVATSLHDVGRNYLHNSMFNITQRGTGIFATQGGYTSDRWKLDFSLDTVNVQPTSLGDSHRANIGDEEATWSIAVTLTGNAGAGAFSTVSQYIENVRRLAGKTVTVSFWAWAASGSPKIGVLLQQSFGTGGSPSAAVGVNGTATPPLTTIPARYSMTFTLPTIIGKTLGTNNDHFTRLGFAFSSGATNNTFLGGIGVQSGTFVIYGVQLELGTVATPLEKLDPVTQLQQCQRFFQAHTNFQPYLYAPAASGVSTDFAFPVTMRATPQITYTTVSYGNASGITALAYTASHLTTQFTVTTAGTGVAFFGFTASADL